MEDDRLVNVNDIVTVPEINVLVGKNDVLGNGYFTVAYEINNIVYIRSACKLKYSLGKCARSLAHLPQVELLTEPDENGIFWAKMPKYTMLYDFMRHNPDNIISEIYREYLDEILQNSTWYSNDIFLKYLHKLGSTELIVAFEFLKNIGDNIENCIDFCLDVRDDNLAIDSEGNLILMDIFAAFIETDEED